MKTKRSISNKPRFSQGKADLRCKIKPLTPTAQATEKQPHLSIHYA